MDLLVLIHVFEMSKPWEAGGGGGGYRDQLVL